MMIFCVEDDRGIRELMTYTLNASGYDALGLKDGKELDEALKNQKPCLITLDIMLPNEDGISILKRLKNDERYHDIPIIMASAKGEEYDKVIGLDLGADDYLAKPFGMMELLSRIRALLRRTAVRTEEYRLGVLRVVPEQHIVEVNGEAVTLTQKEFEMLSLMIRSPGQVFSREKLIESVWGYAFAGETRTVDVHVRTLRQKLGAAGAYIETVRGYGYKMTDARGAQT